MSSASLPNAPLQVLDDPIEQARFTTWQDAPGGAREATSQFRLSGLHCGACAGLIEAALQRVDGVLEAQVQAAAELARVRWDPRRTRPSALVAAIQAAGYGAVPDAAAGAREERRTQERRALWRLAVAGLCMMQVMMYATPAYVAEPGDISAEALRLLQWASWLLSLPVLLFSSGPFFTGAWRALRARRLGMDVPVALGIAVTFVASSGATFDPGGVFGHEVYFDSLTMFVFFLLAGRWLEVRARHRAADTLEQGAAGLPETAQRLREDGSVETVSPGRLQAGDRVRVLAGQALPADGELLEGRALVDEALLSGESTPLPKRPGDELVAGSTNLQGPLLMRVLRVGEDTRQAAIVRLMRSALTQRPRVVQLAERIAGPFLWGVLLLAALAAAGWSLIDPSRAVWVAVSVLIVTCPCALSLAAPSALLAAAGGLARQGLLLQRLEALEALAGIDTVMLDKTGTLTEDRLEIAETRVLDDGIDPGVATRRAASLASLSAHPAARALAVHHEGDAADWRDVEELPGAGLQARDAQGRLWRLGRRAWVDATQPESGGSALWFGCEGRAQVVFALRESLRADAAQTVQALQAAGLQVMLLSGDAPARAHELARRLGITRVEGGASPADKLALLAAAQQGGARVAMVGDGINDAPVLARADVSFAFAHGAAVARAQADLIVLGSRLGVVAQAREQARRTLRVIRQNLAWAALYNAACVPLALAGWLPPWAAGLGMAASSLAVVSNALRLARTAQPA